MLIKVLGPGCAKCKEAENVVNAAVHVYWPCAFQVRSHGLDRYAGRSCFRSFDFHRLLLRRQVLTVNGAVYPPRYCHWRGV